MNDERYKKNPFRDIVIKNTIKGTSTIYNSPKDNDSFALVSNETGEYSGNVTFGMRISVDKTHFIKMYANGVKMFLGLTNAGIKVFMLIFDQLMADANYQADKVELLYELLEEEQQKNLSKSTFFRGIRELKQANFLASSFIKGVYWLNTDYVFRGNRLTLVNQYILEDKETNSHSINTVGQSLRQV